jgi:GAF domain-containing protein
MAGSQVRETDGILRVRRRHAAERPARHEGGSEAMPVDPGRLSRGLAAMGAVSPARLGLRGAVEQATKASVSVFEDVDGAGLMLVDPDDTLRWVTASSPAALALERGQEEVQAGPCVDAYRKATVVHTDDLATDPRYQELWEHLRDVPLRSVLSAPVQITSTPVGSLNVYAARPRDWDDTDADACVAMARVLAALLQAAVTAQLRGVEVQQLRYALEHRVVIEQAKGILMEREGLDAQGAFDRIRSAARRDRVRVAEVAHRIVRREPWGDS